MVFYTAVHFRCKAELEFGYTLVAVGDHIALGNWEPKQGHQLDQSKTVESVWNSRAPAYLPLREKRKYKYAVLDGIGDFVRWHDEEVRHVEPTGNEMILEDDNGYYRTHCSTFSGLDGDGHVNGESMAETSDGTTQLKVLKLLQKLDVDPSRIVYFITSRLPIQVSRKPDGGFAIRDCNTPLTTTMWHVRHRLHNRMRFIGACMVVSDNADDVSNGGASSEDKTKTESTRNIFTLDEKNELRRLLWEYDCIPVFVSSDEQRKSMLFCKKYLWHLFYNIGLWDINEQQEFDWELWHSHLNINREYSKIAREYATDGDFFWVHDYKLLMVPQYITRKTTSSNIGIFMHAMFPPSSLFSCLAVRDMILRSMLCADLIGFQFFPYARHFLSCCKQVLGVDHSSKPGGMLDIEYNGRDVMILLSHSHIQPDLLAEKVCENSGVPALVSEMKDKWKDRFIVASVDRDVRLAGLSLKLKAFRKFLRDYPYARHNVLLIQYVCAADTLWECRTDVSKSLKEMANSINEEFKGVHVVLEFSVTQQQRYALLVAADCFLDTSIRGGINLRAMEYIYCRQGKPAAAVLSEFVGFSKILLSAKPVNPWNVDSIVEALDACVSSDPKHRMDVCKRDFDYIVGNDTVEWVNHFVRELFCARKRQDMRHVSVGLGRTYKTYSLANTFRPLDVEHLMEKYVNSKRRLIFLDCEGTLCPSFWGQPPRSSQDLETAIKSKTSLLACNVENIHKLAKNTANLVVVISGQSRSHMENIWFKGLKEVGLCSGYGIYYKVPAITGDDWKCMLDCLNEEWRKPVLQIMEQYVHRTPGSYVENMEGMVVFQFHHADPEFAVTQSTELFSVLKDALSPYAVDVQCNKWNVLVIYKGINKGAALLNIAKRYSAVHGDFDFALCIGDHKSDEDMFKALATLDEMVHGKPSARTEDSIRDAKYISCTVGMKPSKAMYYLNSYTDVAEVLANLTHY